MALVEIEARMKRKVMTYEIDFAGIMSNQVYQRWLEDLRMELMLKFADIRTMTASGIVPVLSRTEIDFRKPLFLMDEIEGVIKVDEMTDTKFVLKAEFLRGAEVCARAVHYGVFVDVKTMKTVRAPDYFPRVAASTLAPNPPTATAANNR